MNNTEIRVALGGDIGSGKDDSAIGVRDYFTARGVCIKYLSVGNDIIRPLAAQHNIPFNEFLKQLKLDSALDKQVDLETLKAFDEKRSLVVTSRMAAALAHRTDIYHVRDPHSIIKIFFDCDENERVRRVCKREFKKVHHRDPTTEEIAPMRERVRREMLEREELDERRYRALYNIKNIYDAKYFDYVMDTTNMTLPQQVEVTCEFVMSRL